MKVEIERLKMALSLKWRDRQGTSYPGIKQYPCLPGARRSARHATRAGYIG